MSFSRSVMVGENADIFPLCQRGLFRDTLSAEADKIPLMTKTVHDRIRELIAARKISNREAERFAGLADGTLRKLLNNADQMPSSRTVSAIADAFGVTAAWLLEGDAAGPAADVRNYGPGSAPLFPLREEMPNDIPVMGMAAGNHLRGAFKIGSDVIDYVRRPPALATAKDIYGLFVEGESMSPQYNPGDLIFVSPHKPPKIGDAVVVQAAYNEGEVEGTLGIYTRRDAEWVVIRKHNPPAEVKIKNNSNVLIHKVLSNNEIFGI